MRIIAKLFFLISTLFSLGYLNAATWYIDNAAKGLNNGKTWADAWTSLAGTTGLSAGDIVYISGGPTGSTQTYPVNCYASYPGQWLSVVNGVTYKIGQDAAHNGTAIFDGLGGGYWLVQGWKNVVISGDANDGVRHFKLINCSSAGNGSNWTGVRASYIDFSSIPKGMDFNPATNIEVDHCYFYISGSAPDHCSYGLFNGTNYDTSSFHDNLVYVPYLSPVNGYGADGLQWVGSGYSIYNNTIVGYPSTSYAGGQHQDGWQASGGSYVKVHGNTFIDLANYAIFPEPAVSGYSHLRIYNNICVITRANTTQAIAVSGTSTKVANDVVVANNLAVGYSIPFTFRNPNLAADPAAWVNCGFYNNISVNGGNSIIDPNVASAANIVQTTLEALLDFITYTTGSAANDYHLLATATAIMGKGTSVVSSYFTTDKDGLTRSSWDIGPYSYGGASSLPAPTNTHVIAQ